MLAKHHLLVFIVFSLFLSVSTTLFAMDIKLYDQPKADAKTVGTVDLTAGIIPIFTPKTGDWIKVGDPRNGNVGWIKSSDLQSMGGTTTITFTHKIMNNGKGSPQSYQIIEFGQPKNLSDEEVQAMIQKVQLQQQTMQQSLQKAIQDMNSYWNTMNGTMPMIVPVIVVPEQKTVPKK